MWSHPLHTLTMTWGCSMDDLYLLIEEREAAYGTRHTWHTGHTMTVLACLPLDTARDARKILRGCNPRKCYRIVPYGDYLDGGEACKEAAASLLQCAKDIEKQAAKWADEVFGPDRLDGKG